MSIKKIEKVDELNHLLDFNGCFNSVLTVSYFDCVSFTFLKLFNIGHINNSK